MDVLQVITPATASTSWGFGLCGIGRTEGNIILLPMQVFSPASPNIILLPMQVFSPASPNRRKSSLNIMGKISSVYKGCVAGDNTCNGVYKLGDGLVRDREN